MTENNNNDTHAQEQGMDFVQMLQMFGLQPQDLSQMAKSKIEGETIEERKDRLEQLADEHNLDLNQVARVDASLNMLGGRLIDAKRQEIVEDADPNDIKVAILNDVLQDESVGEEVAKALGADIRTTVEMVAYLNKICEAEDLYEELNIQVPTVEEIYEQARQNSEK